jgi:Galactose oxidase, central domain/Kelch motif
MIPSKKSTLALLGAALLMTACSGLKTNSSSGSGTTTGTFTIGGTVTGLTETGLVLADNATDTLTITPGVSGASVSFTFKDQVSSAYAVTVQTQPTGQTCVVSGGTGTATANVTTVAVACTTNAVTATIGGTLSGLATSDSVILEDNGGDALTLTANGPFTFKTPVTGPTDAYAVTVNTQPLSPTQICTVANGSGTATANVTNVQVACVASYSIGGTVTGLVGTGFIIENSSDNEQLPISVANGNGPFTFKQLVPTGTAYTISIATQPSNPGQTCVVTPSTASGTATANVTNVQVNCPAVTYSIGGTVVGLEGFFPPNGTVNNGQVTDNSFVIQDELGNTLPITENGPFTFATPLALGDQYEVSIFHASSSQSQGCTLWGYKGAVTANVTSIVVDCAHNDWTWIDGGNVAGTVPAGSSNLAPVYGSFPTSAPTTIPNPYTNTPGARYGAAGWTDSAGNLWLFGGSGWELSGKSPADTLNAPMNDLWVCVITGDYCQWQLVGGYDPTSVTLGPNSTSTVGAQIIANAQNEGQDGFYPGAPLAPPSRLEAATWTDSSGNLWMFGGATGGTTGDHYLNDLWEFNTSTFNASNPSTYTTNPGQWTLVTGSYAEDSPGVYPPNANPYPGARTNAVYWTDQNGNFWLFGGYGWDGESPSQLGYLNDLWEYTGGTWVFVSGSGVANQKGNYGAAGTAASTNVPGGRQSGVGWADANGNLWLFGGEGEDSVSTPNGILNDLWVYNIANKQWTWVMGSSTANQNGVYEAQPVVGPTNTTGAANTCGLASGLTINNQVICQPVSTTGAFPGSRWLAAGWVDAGGNFWLYGGLGLDSESTNGNGSLNDLWVYIPNATPTQPGTWAWVKGANTGGQGGNYGSLLRPYATYEGFTPGGRSNATHWVQWWTDSQGRLQTQLWMFGGEGYDGSTPTPGDGYLNDLWRYVPYPD